MVSEESNSEKSVSYQKKDGHGHVRPSFFWYCVVGGGLGTPGTWREGILQGQMGEAGPEGCRGGGQGGGTTGVWERGYHGREECRYHKGAGGSGYYMGAGGEGVGAIVQGHGEDGILQWPGRVWLPQGR